MNLKYVFFFDFSVINVFNINWRDFILVIKVEMLLVSFLLFLNQFKLNFRIICDYLYKNIVERYFFNMKYY